MTAGSVLTYMPDHCPSLFGPGPEGWGEYHRDALWLAEGASALVHDAQMAANEDVTAGRLGHSVTEYAVGLGRRARAGLVVLFHHQPDRSDESLDALAERFATEPGVIVATESLVLAAVSSPRPNAVDAIVVGSGPNGLAAALELAARRTSRGDLRGGRDARRGLSDRGADPAGFPSRRLLNCPVPASRSRRSS